MSSAAQQFRAIASSVPVTDYLDYRDYLRRVYQALKHELGKYSFLQLAADLGLSRSNVAFLIINGQRPLTSRAAKRVAAALALTDQNRLYFEALVAFQNARTTSDRDRHFRKLMHVKAASFSGITNQKQLEFFTEWFNAAIYELALLPDAPTSIEAIGERLQPRVSAERVKKSLELLTELGLLEIDPTTGKIKQTRARISTPPEVESLAMLRFHQTMIALAHQSLGEVHDSARDVTAVTIAIPVAALAEYKRELSLFRERLLSIAEASQQQADVVYQVNLQMFPLTRKAKA